MLRSFFSAVASIPVVLCFCSGCQHSAEKLPTIVPEVVIDDIVVRDVQPYITATGTTQAFEYVEISARVDGFLQEIRYTPGELVAVGAPLFLIQPNQYEAEVKAAAAELASVQAQLELAEADLKRTQSLIPQGAKTQQDLDTDIAQRNVAAANVLRMEAALETAKLNLAYTDVRSPISGKADRNFVDLGNLVGPSTVSSSTENNHTILTSVAGMDPIYVYFDISDHQFNRLREYAKKHRDPETEQLIERLRKIKESNPTHGKKLAQPSTPTDETVEPDQEAPAFLPEPLKGKGRSEGLEAADIEFEISLIQGATPLDGVFPFKGIIDMTGNKINTSTGTITIRGEIPNTDYTIFPGQVCRVRMPIWKTPNAVLVRQEAIGTDLNQNYVYVYESDKKTVRRQLVKLGDTQPDGTRVVTEGLEQGQKYVVFGIQNVRDGQEVKATTLALFEKASGVEKANKQEKQVPADEKNGKDNKNETGNAVVDEREKAKE